MKFTAACMSALLVLCFSSGADAGPIADAAGRAEALQAEGKTVEALDALNEAVDVVWTAAPLAFRKVVLVDSSKGFGDYAERSDRVFRPDEEMLIYVEPVGYGYGTSGAAATINFDVDVAIENTTGQVLGEAKDVFQFSADTYPKRREFAMTLGFGAPYYRPGDYKVIFTVRDRNSPKSGSFEIPFTLTTPGAGDAPAAGAESAAAPADAPADGGSATEMPAEGPDLTAPDGAPESGSEGSLSGAAGMQDSKGAADQSSAEPGAASEPPPMESQESDPNAGSDSGAGESGSGEPKPQ